MCLMMAELLMSFYIHYVHRVTVVCLFESCLVFHIANGRWKQYCATSFLAAKAFLETGDVLENNSFASFAIKKMECQYF